MGSKPGDHLSTGPVLGDGPGSNPQRNPTDCGSVDRWQRKTNRCYNFIRAGEALEASLFPPVGRNFGRSVWSWATASSFIHTSSPNPEIAPTGLGDADQTFNSPNALARDLVSLARLLRR